MATYKKRGFKNKASSNKAEALEQKSTTANVFNSLDEGSSKAQIWVEKNKNIIFSFVAIIAFSVIGFLFYSFQHPNHAPLFSPMLLQMAKKPIH